MALDGFAPVLEAMIGAFRGLYWGYYAVLCKILYMDFGELQESELRHIGLLGSSPFWSFQKFASGRMSTPGSTTLNATFASA